MRSIPNACDCVRSASSASGIDNPSGGVSLCGYTLVGVCLTKRLSAR